MTGLQSGRLRRDDEPLRQAPFWQKALHVDSLYFEKRWRRKYMQRLIALVGFLFILAVHSQAQDCCKRGEIFGSFSYFSASSKTDRIPKELGFNGRISQRGFGIDTAYNFKKNWAIVADFSQQTKDEKINGLNADTTTNNYLFGLRLAPHEEGLSPFAEALVGASRRKTVIDDLRIRNTDFALGFGGGIDIEADRNFAVRVLRFDYIPIRGGDDAEGVGRRWSQNFRAQVGIIFRFGPVIQ
jgi:outer membrane protein with beta-barrel domain